MPTQRYPLRRGEPKRVEVFWSTSFKNLTVRLDGNVIGTVPTKQELKVGRGFPLGDGSVLQVQLVQSFLNTQLRILRNGQPLPGSPSDPFRILTNTYSVIFFIGGLSAVVGIVLALLQVSGLQASGIGLIISGLIFIGLGFFVRRRSTIALGIAVALYALDALALTLTGRLAGIPLHIVFLIAMIRGFSAIRAIRDGSAQSATVVQEQSVTTGKQEGTADRLENHSDSKPQTLPGSGKVSLVYGLIFGGIIGIIDIVYSAILDTTNPSFLVSLSQALSSLNTVLFDIVYGFSVSIPIYILLFVSFLLAGLFAARKTKKASTGMLAGLWVGVLYLVMDLLIANILLTYVILFPQYAQSGGSASEVASLESSTLTAAISYSLVAGLILIGIGLGVGALGGVMGKGGATPAQAYPPPYQPYQTQAYANPNQFPYGYGQSVPPGQVPPAHQAQVYANPNQFPQGQEPPPGQVPPHNVS